jgi:hypothetical protein
MAAIIPDIAKPRMSKIWTLEVAPGQLKVHLFKNNYTPDHTTVLANLTEANFTGYASADADNPVTQAALDVAGRAFVLWDMIRWTKAGATGNDIYGYWVVDSGGNLLWVERFITGVFSMNTDGSVLQFFPKLTWASQFSNT